MPLSVKFRTSLLKGLVNININRSGLRDFEAVNLKIEELHRLIQKISPPLTPVAITKNATARKEAPKTKNMGNTTPPPKRVT